MKNIHRLVLRAVLSALVLCLPGLSAHADDLSDTLVYAGENEDTINPLLNNHQELPTIIFSGLMKYDAKGAPVPDLETVTYTYCFGENNYNLSLLSIKIVLFFPF